VSVLRINNLSLGHRLMLPCKFIEYYVRGGTMEEKMIKRAIATQELRHEQRRLEIELLDEESNIKTLYKMDEAEAYAYAIDVLGGNDE